MTVISSKRTFWAGFFRFSLIVFLPLLFFYFYKFHNIPVLLILFIGFLMLYLRKKITEQISISNDDLEIIYYRWGIRKYVHFDIRYITTEIKDCMGARGTKYQLLNILDKDRVGFSVSSLDGFDKDDFDCVISKTTINKEG